MEFINELFFAIAHAGIEAGKEISLEKKDYGSNSDVLSGAFSKTNMHDGGLILRVFDPVNGEESEADE